MRYIHDLTEGQHIIEFYLCRERQTLTAKNGKDYVKMTLEDKTGSINAMVWDLSYIADNFAKGDIVKVDGKVQSFNNAMQINILRIRKARENEYNVSDFYHTSRVPSEVLYERALGMIEQIRDEALRRLVFYFYRDNARLAAKLKEHPAAKSIHHGYIGGLLEHSTSVASIALSYRDIYPQLDQDLLIAGGLLHDIGKLEELQPLPSGDYSDAGRLLGHITIGYRMVYEQGVKMADLSTGKLTALCHMILSHHGKLEFASPVVPSTMEAIALNLADLADSQLKLMEDAIRLDTTEGNWTAYNRALERYIYKAEDIQ
ncbi:MAG: HD domain-containing protein [Lachnospiraceae bacterium]|nr:HD domain-containing protein [Lachnospiraceae bacterium]